LSINVLFQVGSSNNIDANIGCLHFLKVDFELNLQSTFFI